MTIRLNCIALAALLSAIFIPHLRSLNYSAFSFEVGFFALVAVFLGFGVGYIARSRIFFGVVLGFCIYFFLDAYFVEYAYAPAVMVFCVLGTPILLRYAATNLPLAVFLFSVSFTASEFFDTQQPMLDENDSRMAQASNIDAPDVAYIHLILDEQMSPLVAPEQMPDDFSSQDFFDPYLRNGFKVYGLANANSKNTFESLSSIFGLTNTLENYEAHEWAADYSFVPKHDVLVQNLVDFGFSTTVIQSTFIYLCGNNEPVNCRTYSRVSDLSILKTLDLSLTQRLTLAFVSLHDQFIFGDTQVFSYQRLAIAMSEYGYQHRPKKFGYFSWPLVNASILRDISEQVANIEPGQALVAHLLIPHFPYSVDRNCDLKAPSDWRYPLRHDYLDDPTSAYEAFWEQSICASGLVANVLDHVRDRDDVVVFVHGDHGARILFDTDLQNDADSFGTFLAVKSPNQSAGLHRSPISLQDAFIQEYMSAVGTTRIEN